MDLQSSVPTITSFPIEILAEIFLHCLPDSPLNEAQPNLRVAPMLLCHVCSSWRAIALSLPRLWSHLCVSLPMREGNTADPITWNLEALPNVMEFMKWWRGYQRLGAPFIRIKSGQEDGMDEWLLPDNIIGFLCQYLSSAQYIDIARGLLSRIAYKSQTEETKSKDHGLSPTLRALAVECEQKIIEEGSFVFVHFPINIPATLRRLSLRCADITLPEHSNWSLLTHISLDNVLMPYNNWHPLVRVLRNLQWGFFHFYMANNHLAEYSPGQTTLPCLRTLILASDNPFKFAPLALANPPTHLFFMDLNLPALRNLSMKSQTHTWKHPTPNSAIAEIKNLLRSAPEIEELTLGPQFLCFKDHSDSNAPSSNHESCLEIDTLSSLAPTLSHLQLELPCSHQWEEDDVILDRFALWCRSFSYMHWVDLESPKNTIRKITVVVQMGRNASLIETLVRDNLTAFIEEYKHKVPGVEFEIIWKKNEGRWHSVDEWITCGSI